MEEVACSKPPRGSPRRCAPLWFGTRVMDTVPAAEGQVNRGIGADPFVDRS
jgi:hypothetical protein